MLTRRRQASTGRVRGGRDAASTAAQLWLIGAVEHDEATAAAAGFVITVVECTSGGRAVWGARR